MKQQQGQLAGQWRSMFKDIKFRKFKTLPLIVIFFQCVIADGKDNAVIKPYNDNIAGVT